MGWGIVATCAAIRAGITRPTSLHDLYLTDQDLLESVPLVGHPVSGLTDGFGPLGRWLQLAQACVCDLRQEAGLPPAEDVRFWGQTGWIFVLPHLEEARYLEVQDFGSALLTAAWLKRLKQLLGLSWRQDAVHFIHAGHAGTAAAIHLAGQLLAARNVERLVIVAVDSYLDETSLEWLWAHRRLKSPDRPVGLMPGEAGACLLVESLSGARQRGASVLALLPAAGAGCEDRSFLSGQHSSGEALARLVEQVLPAGLAGSGAPGELVCDLNGEEWRARAWGHFLIRLHARQEGQWRVRLPCISVGDVGAASGALGICMVARSFARKYSAGSHALVLSSAEHGDVGAIHLQAPGGGR
ncbi:hypothetical protein D7V88_22900 [Corallococcus terminator]|uniref:Beta-ketoacyl synthase N-terminal domain-containing protein n=1 Tax=Corallococcus terminator TaxID=2316733 RepID=A0A3A8INH8_9BACT|nr:hypothetical protein D7V88_22900 [Corallococcus terminator]